MMELAGIDWRGALVYGEQACHTPCPCHASQPHSSHTDANQARLPWKEVPEKCQQTPEQARKAPSYASPKLSLADLLTGVKCRATSVAKKKRQVVCLISDTTNNHACSIQDWQGDGGLCQKTPLQQLTQLWCKLAW